MWQPPFFCDTENDVVMDKAERLRRTREWLGPTARLTVRCNKPHTLRKMREDNDARGTPETRLGPVDAFCVTIDGGSRCVAHMMFARD